MILASLALGLRQYPSGSGVLSLRSLLTDIFSGTGYGCFEEGYSQLRLPILGSISVVPRNKCASKFKNLTVIKVIPLFRATSRYTNVSGRENSAFPFFRSQESDFYVPNL